MAEGGQLLARRVTCWTQRDCLLRLAWYETHNDFVGCGKRPRLTWSERADAGTASGCRKEPTFGGVDGDRQERPTACLPARRILRASRDRATSAPGTRAARNTHR